MRILQINVFWRAVTRELLKIITVVKTTFFVLRRLQILWFQVVSRTSTQWTIDLTILVALCLKRWRFRTEIFTLSSLIKGIGSYDVIIWLYKMFIQLFNMTLPSPLPLHIRKLPNMLESSGGRGVRVNN